MTALFVDDLTVIDFSYLDAQRGIVGESWIVDVILEGELNDEGMVFDFGFVKKQIKAAIDSGIDHKLVIPTQLANIQINEQADRIHVSLTQDSLQVIDYQSPREAVYLLDAPEVSIAAVRPELEKYLKTIVPNNVHNVKIALRAENIAGAFYHYSHGLKKHQGDCQRICHGHRSQIHVLLNDVRSDAAEQYWAKRWQDIYLITNEDIMQTFVAEGIEYVQCGYNAEQGRFEVTLPKSRCDFLTTDTTVELIANFIAEQTAIHFPQSRITIKAFEGVSKGAYAQVNI